MKNRLWVNRWIIPFVCLVLCACETHHSSQAVSIDVQGHRGARGHYPENTISGFLYAVELGVQTLELDVVISKDSQVLLSHEPWFSADFCEVGGFRQIGSHPVQSDSISLADQGAIYHLLYDDISQVDCGTKAHPHFPGQQKVFAAKPLLAQVFDSVNAYCESRQHASVYYNIEIKSTPQGDDLLHPAPATFVKLVMDVIQDKKMEAYCNIQAFDPRPLRLISKQYPDMKLSYLYSDVLTIAEIKDSIGFVPEILSPLHKVVDETLVKTAHAQGMKVIPWTLNDSTDINRMIELGVDGIISDYPDRVLSELATSTHQ